MAERTLFDRTNVVKGIKGFESLDPVVRFWAKVQKSDGCWIWTGSKNPQGYGALYVNGHLMKAHRYSWLLHHGQHPGKLHVCHHCDNPACVRPDHLFLGTAADNLIDCVRKGRAHAKITEANVREIKRLVGSGEISQTQAARRFGVSISTVHGIIKGRWWKHVG